MRNSDHSIDCVHTAFEKVLVYLQKHPGRKVSGFLLLREVTKEATRLNKRYEKEAQLNDTFESSGDSTNECS